MAKTERADLVVVGAGMVGGWAAWFAATSGAERVVVLERDLAGQGACPAAGVVRARAGRRPRSRSAGSRSTSTAGSSRGWGPTPGSGNSAT